MANTTTIPAVLLLADGTIFHGHSAGKIGTSAGELCFNTGMTGYQEFFTDPSYTGQLLVSTNVHVGNYGIKDAEKESDSIKIAGLICRNFNTEYSRAMADEDIQTYFEKDGLVGITDIDTRAVVRHIRSKGAMNAIISSETTDIKTLKAQIDALPSMVGLELATSVSTKTPYTLGANDATYKVAVLDFGVKQNILRCFLERNCQVKIFPANTPYETLREWNPDGYFLSNGPGDPEPLTTAIATTKEILKHNHPLFGICLGHQILALANDIPTRKMHNGHRGTNHPVKNLVTGLCEITSQNHGFVVDAEALAANADKIEVTHINLNDNTVEGIRIKEKRAFSVQYHPEAGPGPHDARYLFDDFVAEMKLKP
jgi:carbamoyl-phosphate synthase small subunit